MAENPQNHAANSNARPAEKPPGAAAPARKPDDDSVGQVYDSQLIRRLARYLWPYWGQALISTIAVTLKSMSDVAGPFLIMVGIDHYFPAGELADHASAMRGFGSAHWLTRHLSTDPMTGITQLAEIYFALLLAALLFEFVQTYLMQWTGQKIMFDLRRDIFRHMQRMHIGFFDQHAVGRLVTRITSDVDAINEMFTGGILAIVDDVFTLGVMAIFMLKIKWWLALLAFSVLPVILFATRLFRNHVRESYRRVRAAIARINSFTQEHVTGMSIVQLFNREARAYKDFSAVNRQHMVAFIDTIFAYALYYPAVEILSSVAIALVIWRGGFGVLSGSVSIGMLAAFNMYSLRFWRPIQDLSDKFNILQAAMAACERIFKLMDTEPEIVSPAHPRTGDGSNRIEFRHVWFTYQKLTPEQKSIVQAISSGSSHPTSDSPERASEMKGTGFSLYVDSTQSLGALTPDRSTEMKGTGFSPYVQPAQHTGALAPEGASEMKGTGFSPYVQPAQSKGALAPEGPVDLSSLADVEWILKDVSFTIQPGQTVAIVGHTGAGKTTLTSLMMRFYDVTAGQILLDGVDLREHDLAELRRHFAVVLQDPFLFTGTLAENIRLGNDDITHETLRRAARDVNVLDFIETLPGGFDEPVRERGNSLSTGQKQLINFARALAYNPRILILDEATSSVDTDTELRIRSALDRMVEGRTSVLIAHRLSTVQRADVILVMHKGQLREIGSHQELLAQRGLYWKLYQLQYKDQELPDAQPPLGEAFTAPAL